MILEIERERGGDGDGFFENIALLVVAKGIEDERVADEKLVSFVLA